MDNGKQHREDLQRIRGFRLIDDDFMNACLENDVEKGVAETCKVLEDVRKAVAEETKIETARNLLKTGKLTQEEIADAIGLPLPKVKEIAMK